MSVYIQNNTSSSGRKKKGVSGGGCCFPSVTWAVFACSLKQYLVTWHNSVLFWNGWISFSFYTFYVIIQANGIVNDFFCVLLWATKWWPNGCSVVFFFWMKKIGELKWDTNQLSDILGSKSSMDLVFWNNNYFGNNSWLSALTAAGAQCCIQP